ncbi:hypothetical protein AMC87_CH01067 [Rhizobium phaseoli]|nr:hypothetical protein AMC87_CH01067 [Rhizobium phaseoli]
MVSRPAPLCPAGPGASHGARQRGWEAARTTISPHPEGPRRTRAGGCGGQPRPSRLRPAGYAPQDEAGERARREAVERAAGTAISPTRSARTLIAPHPGRHAQRSALILRCPARGLEGRGRVAAVASPVLRGSALWATRLRMRLERGRAMRLERGCAAPHEPCRGVYHLFPSILRPVDDAPKNCNASKWRGSAREGWFGRGRKKTNDWAALDLARQDRVDGFDRHDGDGPWGLLRLGEPRNCRSAGARPRWPRGGRLSEFTFHSVGGPRRSHLKHGRELIDGATKPHTRNHPPHKNRLALLNHPAYVLPVAKSDCLP